MTPSGISVPQQIGRYDILEELGRGAMGVVFKARDPFIGRLVAVKTITAGIADDPDLLERFRREAQAAGGLQHPNIVTIYEMSEFEGTPFIAMEYLEGESLEKKIGRQTRLPLVQRLGYLVQACRALDYAHRRGVIHRDIKPANIMVTSEGLVKVVDFGIARIADTAKTQTGAMLGTISYMSPEQVRGQHADQRCDIWALGIVMYELLSYRRPFVGENHAAVLMSIIDNEPKAIREIAPECSQDLETVVLRAIHKEAGQRYQTMEAVLVDLEPIWTSLQKEAVQKLVSHGRELIEGGKLEEASEVLRKSLLIDTGNVTARELFDQVNALIGANPANSAGSEPVSGSRNPQPATVPPAEELESAHRRHNTVVATSPFDPKLSQMREPGDKHRESSDPAARPAQQQTQNRSTISNESAMPSARSHGGTVGGTIFVPSPAQTPRTDRPAPPAAGQRSTVAKTVPPRSAAPQSPAPLARRAAAPKSDRASGKRTPAFQAAGGVILLILGAAGYWKLSARHNFAEQPRMNIPAPPLIPVPAAAQPAEARNAPGATPAVGTPEAATASIEDQQRHLIDLAHEAADSRNYKAAQLRLEEAAKLDGPLNALVKDLRREFSEDAHGADLRQVAQQEQSLWTRAMKDVDAGRFDDSEKSLREILTLPEAGRHWRDAARYVDEIIPERRQQEQLWAREQHESGMIGPEHRLNEVRILAQVLAQGGAHQHEARQKRDSLFSQFTWGKLGKNEVQAPGISASDLAQFPRLKDAVDQAVTQGDAKALVQLQDIRPRFKSIVDGGGLLLPDARDYLNSVIPKAQKTIEDRLAKTEADAAANAKYREVAKKFDQAVATQNTKILRSQIQPEFLDIVNAGGPRTEEAARYVNALIPAALKKSAR
ncbi:MAG TPA: protein kinase [Candidatus Acidoferrales bacterium]|nr:protein kinase [Candidatus Acidoferrales bacterium]